MGLDSYPVRMGLVGLGYWGTRIAEAAAVTPQVRVTKCFARAPAAREAFATQYGYQPVASYHEMLEDASIEAVALITPNRDHYQQIMAAIEHGKHVFVDKPLTATLAEGIQVVQAVRDSGLILAVDHECRWEQPIRTLKHMLDSGVLGRLLMVDANVSTPGGLTLAPTEWRWQRAQVPGGPLTQIGIHHIDLLQYLLGPIRRVQGWQKRQVIEAPIDDTTVTLLEFESGILGYLGSGYASARAAWIRVYGDAAIGIYDRYEGLSVSGEPLNRPTANWLVPPVSYADPILPIQDALADFARCVRNSGPPEVSGMDALTAMAVVQAAVQSNLTGQAVDIPRLLQAAGTASGI
ncbi:MAG: Gfo/Idh/MocA family oxidoreductase [Anaerolineae bacterium]|nr:Gfo/Idh/MocA family oxidoreductase [Anaerolineae bacterium]